MIMITRLLSGSCILLFLVLDSTPYEKPYLARTSSTIDATDTLYVVVKPVDYFQFSWKDWGYTNDWLQEQVVSRLNTDHHKKNVCFISEEDAGSRKIKADRIIELTFTYIQMGELKVRRKSQQVSKRVITGYTNTIVQSSTGYSNTSTPQRPITVLVSATVYYTENYIETMAKLRCRIYNTETGKNILLTQFQDKYIWSHTTVTYSGNDMALSSAHWDIINKNAIWARPDKNELAKELIRYSYNTLINKIRKKNI